MLALFAGVVIAVTNHTFIFSFSTYNITAIIVLLSAVVCIYFSLRSYLELPPFGWIKSTLGIGCLLAVSALAVWQVSANEMQVVNYNLEQVIHGVVTRTGDIDQLDEKIEALMDEGDISSLVAAIVVDDEIVWMRGFGEQDTLDKMHDNGSITKSFVATAVLQLYERGLIDLDDDVNDYLPFNFRHPDYPDVPITFQMLLSNRSCLSHHDGSYDYRAYFMGSSLRQWSEAKRGWEVPDELEGLTYPEFMTEYLYPGGTYYQPDTWSNCRPGTEFVYSTPGFDLLGYLVEQVGGQSFNDYLHENIFIPLKMTNTATTPLDHPENIAVPYERFYGVLAKTNVQIPLSQRRRIGGGGLYSTVGDMANFLIAHMNQGEFEGYQLLQPETVALMHTPIKSNGGDFMQTGYGYGWGIYKEDLHQMWDITFRPRGFQGHGGRTWGYSSAMYMVDDAEGSYGYILLMNHSMVESIDPPWFFSIQMNIQDILLGEAHRYFQDSQNRLSGEIISNPGEGRQEREGSQPEKK